MQVSAHVEPASSKFALYQEICEQLHELLVNERNQVANAANTAALLKQRLSDVNWVGFYFAEEQQLVLGPFQGKTPVGTRAPFGEGICGKAAASAETVVFSEPSSEIAVPLLNWGKLLGVLRVTSASPNRFDADDQEGLESLAAVFMTSLQSDDMPDLSEEAAWG